MNPPLRFLRRLALLAISGLGALCGAVPDAPHGAVTTTYVDSTVLRGTLTGVNPRREVRVYLPPGYADSGRRFPVVYYCHSIFWSPAQMFADGNLVHLLEAGFRRGTVRKFILVVADYSNPPGPGSLYQNSPVSGRWLDFTADELVPFVDRNFHTLPRRESRALVGDFMGGRGALQLAMTHPELFSVVYALHPVATGPGYVPWAYVTADWAKIHAAKSYADLGDDRISAVFLGISQAFLPNPQRPPFYCDFVMEMVNGVPILNPDRVRRAQAEFMLDPALPEHTAALRSLRGLAFDWARYDPNQDHVLSVEAFSRKLEDLGIEHEAESYRGIWWREPWTAHGRFATRVLPFLNEHLMFADDKPER